jgi:hypothetical protein
VGRSRRNEFGINSSDRFFDGGRCIVMKAWRFVSAYAANVGENGFASLLAILFAVSLTPFLFRPSLWFTVLLSTAPFALVLLRARSRLQVAELGLQNEVACLDVFVSNAETYLSSLREHPNAVVREQDIFALAPEGIRRLAPHSKSLIEDVAKGKLYLIDAPPESVLRRHQEELEGQYKEVASFANLSIKLGILGTFFGFILALSTLSELFANIKEERPDLIGITLQNLAYAFVKSIYGLGLAIFITIWISRLRKPLDAIYQRFDEALRFGREFVSRMTLADPGIHTSLHEIRSSLKHLEQRLYDHSSAISESLREHGQLINEQTKTFSLAAQGMVDVQQNWETAFNKLNEAANAFNERTSGAIGQVERGFSAVASKFTDALQLLGDARNDLSRVSESLREAGRQSEDNWARRFEVFLSEAGSHEKNFGQWTEIVTTAFAVLQKQMEMIESELKAGQVSFQSNATTNAELAAVIDRLDNTLQEQLREGIAFRGQGGWRSSLLVWGVIGLIVSILAYLYFL